MANCRICSSKIGFMSTFNLINFDPLSGEPTTSIDLCFNCFNDMNNLKKWDMDAYYRIHNIVDNQNDRYLSEFLERWESVSMEEEMAIEKKKREREKEIEEEKAREIREIKEAQEREKQLACSKILISSGFNFDGYKIIKYSGYISGDDAIQIPRSGVFGSDNGKNLTDALVKIRTQALKELKEAAYALGCNAVIGVDFDYITLEPETASAMGGTLYEPYVICVTANGNAVIIEKE